MIARGASQAELDAITAQAKDFYLRQRQPQQAATAPTLSTSVPNGVVLSDASTTSLAPDQTAAPNSITSSSPEQASYPVSFSEIAALIASGAPIPGIKTIPEKINEEPPTAPQLAGVVQGAGKKPWEKSASDMDGVEGAGEDEIDTLLDMEPPASAA